MVRGVTQLDREYRKAIRAINRVCTLASQIVLYHNMNTYRGVAQLARVPALGAGGRWFESSRPDHDLVVDSN